MSASWKESSFAEIVGDLYSAVADLQSQCPCPDRLFVPHKTTAGEIVHEVMEVPASVQKQINEGRRRWRQKHEKGIAYAQN